LINKNTGEKLEITATVELPITDLHHLCFILSDLKCYGSTISSSRNHLSSANEKERSSEKIARRKISFSTYKMHFFF
jgi:hypothetical protein